MKTKILNALKTNYANLGLGDKAFDGVASFLAKTIKEENEIDGVIKSEDTQNLLKAFQGESDSLRNRNTQLQRDFDAYKAAHPEITPPTPPTPPVPPTTSPELAKILEQQQQIMDEFKRRDAEQRQQTAIANIKTALEKAGCKNSALLALTMKNFALGEKETEEQAIARLTAEYNQNVKALYGEGAIPQLGGQVFTTGDTKQRVEAMNAMLEESGLLPSSEK